MDASNMGETLIRIQTEFVEMPELKLTLAQAQRLWALPRDECEAALDALIEREFLIRTQDRVYLRRSWWAGRRESAVSAPVLTF